MTTHTWGLRVREECGDVPSKGKTVAHCLAVDKAALDDGGLEATGYCQDVSARGKAQRVILGTCIQ